MAGASALLYGARVGRAAEQAARRPRVLLLGDSISIGYTDFVVGMLDGRMNVQRPLNANGGYLNCEGTTKAKSELQSWLAGESWDVIHFNFGLHDLKHVHPHTGANSREPAHPQQADPKQYAENLEEIVATLLLTNARLIFATTTPYLADPGGPLREAGQPELYNEAARAIMKRHDIPVNDLYRLVKSRIHEFLPPKNVHPTKPGYLQMARQVVAHVEQVMGS